jgi:hypothetical protein
MHIPIGKLLFSLYLFLSLVHSHTINLSSSPLSPSNNSNLLTNLHSQSPEKFTVRLLNVIKSMMNDTIQNVALNETCRKSINFAIEDEKFRYITKLFRDSAKNKNDLGSFVDCIATDYIDNQNDTYASILKNITYLIFRVEKLSEKNSSSLSYYFHEGYVFGICTIKHCSDDEYIKVLKEFDVQSGYLFNLTNTTIEIINVNDYIANKYSKEFFIFLIPLYIAVFIIICSFYPKILVCLFGVCFFRKENTEVDIQETFMRNRQNTIQHNSDMLIDYNNKSEFINCFNHSVNVDELFVVKTEANNDSGLSFIKGLRGISLIYVLFGLVYLIILESPLKIYCQTQHKQLMRSILFNIIFIGTRFSPRFLFSLSGYVLCYKFISYLEDRSETEKFNQTQLLKKRRETYNNTSSLEFTKLVSNDTHELQLTNIIRYKDLFSFFYPQIYKLICYVFSVFFFYFSFYHMSTLFYDPNPFWIYLKKNIIKKESFFEVFRQIFMMNFFYRNQGLNVNVFWIIQNEISFFIISTVFIFILYKYQWRLDSFLIILTSFLIVVKVIFFLYFVKESSSLILSGTDSFRTFFINPGTNISYYFIGCYFGLVNYIIQKSITRKDILIQRKTSFTIPIKFVEFFQNQYLLKIGIISLITVSFMTFNCFVFTFLPQYTIERDFQAPRDSMSLLIDIYFIIDSDLMITLFFIILMGLSLIGENLIVPFLSQNFWLFFSRPYFTNIMLIYFSLYHILYHTESRIRLEMLTIIFYSMFCFCLHFLVATFMYVFIELPYKRLNKLITRRLVNKEEKIN